MWSWPHPSIRIDRFLAAPPATVYAAWTDPAILQRWYCPNPDMPLEVTADVVVGGRHRVQMGPHVAEGWELSLGRLAALL